MGDCSINIQQESATKLCRRHPALYEPLPFKSLIFTLFNTALTIPLLLAIIISYIYGKFTTNIVTTAFI